MARGDGIHRTNARNMRLTAAKIGNAQQDVYKRQHTFLLLHHLTNGGLVIIGFLATRLVALKQAIITLRIEQPTLIESRLLKLVINIGSQDVYKRQGYRLYDDTALARLQSILLFRELEFPLKDIKRILDGPAGDRVLSLIHI